MVDKRRKPQTVAKEKRRAYSVAERQLEAARLWLVEKKTDREIGKILGISHTQVQNDRNAVVANRLGELTEGIAVNVEREFHEQLDFAKELREQAKAILSDPDDPLKLTLVPQAHEIEVVYYDHKDLFMGQPKRKKAMLSVILESLPEAAGIEPSKFTIKTIDVRKFALEALATADMCIDKFARMGGAYKRQEDANVGDLADKLVERLVQKGWETTDAREFAQKKYGNLKLVK